MWQMRQVEIVLTDSDRLSHIRPMVLAYSDQNQAGDDDLLRACISANPADRLAVPYFLPLAGGPSQLAIKGARTPTATSAR